MDFVTCKRFYGKYKFRPRVKVVRLKLHFPIAVSNAPVIQFQTFIQLHK